MLSTSFSSYASSRNAESSASRLCAGRGLTLIPWPCAAERQTPAHTSRSWASKCASLPAATHAPAVKSHTATTTPLTYPGP